VHVTGPNGFLRSFRGSAGDPAIRAFLEYPGDGNVALTIENAAADRGYEIEYRDRSYGLFSPARFRVEAGASRSVRLDLEGAGRWYDLEVLVTDFAAYRRGFAGRVETGEVGISDPAMATSL
jgi:phospholipase C